MGVSLSNHRTKRVEFLIIKEFKMSNTETERRNRQSETALAENMRAKEAHKFLSIGLSTLWAFVAQKKIKAYKLSDRVTIFKRSELEAFINSSAEVD